MVYGLHDKLKEAHDDPEGDYVVNIGLKNNGIISDLAFSMIYKANQIHETFPEYNQGRAHQIRLNKIQNALYYSFRSDLRLVVNTTKSVLMRNQGKAHINFDKSIKQIDHYLNKEYGSYDIRHLVTAAEDFFGILTVMGIVPIVLSYNVEDSLSIAKKG